jgi:hypothetical protein
MNFYYENNICLSAACFDHKESSAGKGRQSDTVNLIPAGKKLSRTTLSTTIILTVQKSI